MFSTTPDSFFLHEEPSDPKILRTRAIRRFLISICTIILWLVSTIIFASLISCRSSNTLTTTTTSDTVIILTHDTIIHDHLIPISIPADSASFFALLECDSNNQLILRQVEILNGRNNRLTYTLDSLGRLDVRSIFPPDTIYIPTHDTLIVHDQSTNISTNTDTQTTTTGKDSLWIRTKLIFSVIIFTILALLSIPTIITIIKKLRS